MLRCKLLALALGLIASSHGWATASLRLCIVELPPLAYRGPFQTQEGVIQHLVRRIFGDAGIPIASEIMSSRLLLKGVLEGSCDAAVTPSTPLLNTEDQRSWALMDLTEVLIPGIFDRPVAGLLIPAGRYGVRRYPFSEEWTEHIAGFESVPVDRTQDAWEWLELGLLDGLIGIREHLAWYAVDSERFQILFDYAIPVAQRKLRLYLSEDLSDLYAGRVESAIENLDLEATVRFYENRSGLVGR